MPKSTSPQPSSLRLLILSPASSKDEDNNNGNITVPTGKSNAQFMSFLTGLTSTAPSRDLTSFAGYTTHSPLQIHTKYYAASVTLWCDELPPLSSPSIQSEEPSLPEWVSQMLSLEAQEVREVIGSIVVLSSFDAASTKQDDQVQNIMNYITEVNKVREAVEDESGRDVATILAIQDVTPSATAGRQSAQDHNAGFLAFTQRLEETCLEERGIFGWDIIAWRCEKPAVTEDADLHAAAVKEQISSQLTHGRTSTERNEHGEKVGMARVHEVLEQVNWTVSDSTLDHDNYDGNDYDLVSADDFLDSDDDFSSPSYKPTMKTYSKSSRDAITEQSDEFQREIMGLHFALEEQISQDTHTKDEDSSDIQVEQLSSLMERVVAIKEAGSEMPKADREKFARREVGKIMRELDFADSK